MEYKVSIKNLPELKAYFKKFPSKVSKEMDTAVKKSVLVIERNAKRTAPVNKQSGGGNLRQSIRSGMTGKSSGFVEVGAEYAPYVEFGTAPHIIRAVSRKGLANTRTGQFFGKVVRHPGTKATNFFGRGIDNSKTDIDNLFDRALVAIIS